MRPKSETLSLSFIYLFALRFYLFLCKFFSKKCFPHLHIIFKYLGLLKNIINANYFLMIIKNTMCMFGKIIFVNLFYYLTYFYYYLWVSLYFLVLFMDLTILFQLTFTFIYNIFSTKISISTK